MVYCIFEYDIGIVVFKLDFGDGLEKFVCVDFFFFDVFVIDYFGIFFGD